GPAHHHQTWYQAFLTLSFEGCCFWFCSTVLLANVCAFMPEVCRPCGCVASEWSELPPVLCALFMAVRFRPSAAAAVRRSWLSARRPGRARISFTAGVSARSLTISLR